MQPEIDLMLLKLHNELQVINKKREMRVVLLKT
jgi:hypothetical protein